MLTNDINLLIIDDEIGACDNLQSILSEFIAPGIHVVGVANNTIDAEILVKKLNPNAVFLDIEMPDENAFQFLERIQPINFEIVFITAYDEFAIKAFKLNAVDYILKPVDIDELSAAVSKLKDRIYFRQLANGYAGQLKALAQIAGKEPPSKITLKELNHVEIVDFDDIYSLEGISNYCRTTFNKNGIVTQITTSHTVSFYEDILPFYFYRVHKSYVVNCKRIQNIISGSNCYLVLNNKEEIAISRRRYNAFIDFVTANNFYSV